jgi:hypothetical protein
MKKVVGKVLLPMVKSTFKTSLDWEPFPAKSLRVSLDQVF